MLLPSDSAPALKRPTRPSGTVRGLLSAAALALIATVPLVSGCTSSSESADAAGTTTSVVAPVAADTQVVTVLTTSVEKNLHTAGVAGEHVYGFNHLAGTGRDGTDAVGVEMLATVDYTNGSGDFDGVITLTYPDGATVGFRMVDGSTTAATDTTEAIFHSELTVIDGTGRLAGARGSGTFDGARKDALGGAVDMTFRFQLS